MNNAYNMLFKIAKEEKKEIKASPTQSAGLLASTAAGALGGGTIGYQIAKKLNKQRVNKKAVALGLLTTVGSGILDYKTRKSIEDSNKK